MNIKYLAISALTVAALAGCAKDRNLDDYRQQRTSQNLANYQAVAGTFRSALVSEQTGKSMGNIQIELTATTVPVNSSDNTGTDQQAIMQGKVTINNGVQSSAIIKSANFTITDTNTNSGILSGTISVNVAGSSTPATLTISGALSGSQFSGVIFANDRPGERGRFAAIRNGSFPGGQPSNGGRDPSDLGRFSGFEGESVCTGSGADRTCRAQTEVRMGVRQFTGTMEETFLNVFTYQKSVSVLVEYVIDAETTLPLSFESATIDFENGRIRAQKLFSGTVNAILTLECNRQRIDEQTLGWGCSLASNQNTNPKKFLLAPIK